jgi:hypothetical protein
MKLFGCSCGQTLFFENSLCVRCGGELGYCPSCRRVVRLRAHGDGRYQCEQASCGAWLRKCYNYTTHGVCNRCVLADEAGVGSGGADALCDSCELTRTIPDLSVAGNLEKWSRLEAAKRRLLYGLELVGLEVGRPGNTIEPKLVFDFKADVLHSPRGWGNPGERERVFTGHLDGRITINISEADDVEREKARVSLGERYRTLLGHFRHEIGHYVWDVLVRGRDEVNCSAVFGDPYQPDYETAKANYYAGGAPGDWPSHFATMYAAMHPWEDFAETFALYLDMHAALDTAHHCGMPMPGYARRDLRQMVGEYLDLGTRMNELNRSMGLNDWLARLIPPAVEVKLDYIHGLVRRAAAGGAGA